jgi:hypothetical protein
MIFMVQNVLDPEKVANGWNMVKDSIPYAGGIVAICVLWYFLVIKTLRARKGK